MAESFQVIRGPWHHHREGRNGSVMIMMAMPMLTMTVPLRLKIMMTMTDDMP
jgi:hypothetical protein